MTDPSPSFPLAIEVSRRFEAEFGGAAAGVFFAPGRVNLIGAHLDYNGGSVLPVAVDRGVYVAARVRDDDRIRLHSLDQEPPLEIRFSAIGERADAGRGWANYPLGVLRSFAQRTGCARGVDLVFAGDLPIAAGLSSSAAIEVATAFALNACHRADLELADLARVGFAAETDYIGVPCGIMDQFASALGRCGQALLLDCSNESYEHVPFDDCAVEILVMDSMVSRRLGETGYDDRVRECAAAHEQLRRVRDLPRLARYSLHDIESAGADLSSALRQRAEHVVREMDRVRLAVDSLRQGDLDALGRALEESHESTRDLFEVSCAELDELVFAAVQVDEVYGARLTGAGFGGCAIALLQPGSRDRVETAVADHYLSRFGRRPRFDLLHSGAGPRELSPS